MSPTIAGPAWDHRVQFYDSDEFLFDSVADFLSDGFRLGEPVVILSTARHRDGVRERLTAAGLDWDAARRSQRLRWIDARAALEGIMIGRTPDPVRFEDQIGRVFRLAAETVPGVRRVRAYGELVDLLWCEGNADAALRLEDLWNDLGRAHELSLLCAYSPGDIYRESRGARTRQVCDRHAHVLPFEPGMDADHSA